MTLKFPDTNDRNKKIDRAGLVMIYERMLKAKCDHLTAPEIEDQIKRFGRCECHEKCKEPLAGQCDFDHKYPNAVSRKGDVISWQALHPDHHDKKTHKHDVPHIAKIKRLAVKYNPEYIEEQDEKPKKEWASRPMQRRGFDKTRRKKMNGEVEYVKP